MIRTTSEKRHLCHYCYQQYPKCHLYGGFIEFSKDWGADNIIACDSFLVPKWKETLLINNKKITDDSNNEKIAECRQTIANCRRHSSMLYRWIDEHKQTIVRNDDCIRNNLNHLHQMGCDDKGLDYED